VECLFDGTTNRSCMSKVRKRWREHLKAASDDKLRAVVRGLRVLDGAPRSISRRRSWACSRATLPIQIPKLVAPLEPAFPTKVYTPLHGTTPSRYTRAPVHCFAVPLVPS
jgi:hypothetical protein